MFSVEVRRSPWPEKLQEKRQNCLEKWNIDIPSSRVNNFTSGRNTITAPIPTIIMIHGGFILMGGGDSASNIIIFRVTTVTVDVKKTPKRENPPHKRQTHRLTESPGSVIFPVHKG